MNCYHNENRVIRILMDRNGITYDKAKQLVSECRDALLDEANSLIWTDEIIMDYLGLESDYLYDILDV